MTISPQCGIISSLIHVYKNRVVALATSGLLLQASYRLLCFFVKPTSYTCSSICRYMGVHCDLWVQNAAMGVGIHLQRVQQLSVVLHSVVISAALLWNQLGNSLWRKTSYENKR